MGNLTKSPLIICCIIGIILGYGAGFVLGDYQNQLLTVGLVAGLALGYFLDLKNQNSLEGGTGDDGAKQNPLDVLGGEAASNARAKINETDDLMARARAGLSGEAVEDPVKSIPEATDVVTEPQPEKESPIKPIEQAAEEFMGSPETAAAHEKISDAEDLIARARAGLSGETPEDKPAEHIEKATDEIAGDPAVSEAQGKINDAEDLIAKARAGLDQ